MSNMCIINQFHQHKPLSFFVKNCEVFESLPEYAVVLDVNSMQF